MAIDLCSTSESSGLGMMSPRISFSHDLRHSESDDVVPVEEYCQRSDASLLDSSSSFDFDFGVTASFEQEEPPFSADELFFDGKILPCDEIREKKPQQKIPLSSSSKQTHQAKPPPPPPPLPPLLPLCPPPSPTDTMTTRTTTMSKKTSSSVTDHDSKKESSLKEIMATTSTESEDNKSSSKSFWRFKRSTSLNSGNGQRRSLICSLPLLSRSNSTGSSSSTTSSKRQPLLKDSQKHSHKPPTPTPAKSSSSSSSSSFLSSSSSSSSQSTQKGLPPLKKNSSGSYGNGGVRISPILNIPPPYIGKGTANLFGLGSLFCGGSGKDKNRKK